MWIVTGAAGFLGNTIVRRLCEAGQRVRACVFEEGVPESLEGVDCEVVRMDVRELDQVRAALSADGPVWVIHAAGVVSIARKVTEAARTVNVTGTKNVLAACRELGVQRLVYVSSVHAIAAPDSPRAITELSSPEEFDPAGVVGEYAKTKAEATAAVLQADDLWRAVVHPSGITGPGDYGDTHLTALVRDLATGKLKALVRGGYDFADVRDVADGVIAAATKGTSGRCYILSGEYVSVRELGAIVARAAGRKRAPRVLPMWIAKAIVPFAEAHYLLWKLTPKFTKYSLWTLLSASDFSHARAREELDYSPRPVAQTLRDTVEWVTGRVR